MSYHISGLEYRYEADASHCLPSPDVPPQVAYRGAASELPMVPEARLSGHSRSAMVSVRPVLSTTIIV